MSEQPRTDLLDDLVTLISEPTPKLRRPSRPLRSVVVLVAALLAVSGLALVASAVPRDRFPLFSRDATQLGKLAEGLVSGLGAGGPEAALAWCAEHPALAERLASEDRRVYGGGDGASIPVDVAREARLETLGNLRADLERMGLDWTRARPVAFVGVRGKVRDAETMRRSVEVALGRILVVQQPAGDGTLGQGAQVFAIECSARKVGRTYALVDLWSWEALDVPVNAVDVEADEQLRAIQREVQAEADGRITGVRPFRATL